MKLYRFYRTQTLSVSTEEAWHFFSSPLNLPSITPPKLHLAVSGEVRDTILPIFSQPQFSPSARLAPNGS
jgi:ligand-binding SRPBCC domain-containing protein